MDPITLALANRQARQVAAKALRIRGGVLERMTGEMTLSSEGLLPEVARQVSMPGRYTNHPNTGNDMLGVVAYEDKAYAFSGVANHAWDAGATYVQVYDPATGAWSFDPGWVFENDMGFYMYGAYAPVIGSKAYMLVEDLVDWENHLAVIDFDAKTVTYQSPPSKEGSAQNVNGFHQLFLLNGELATAWESNIYVYDPVDHEMKITAHPMPPETVEVEHWGVREMGSGLILIRARSYTGSSGHVELFYSPSATNVSWTPIPLLPEMEATMALQRALDITSAIVVPFSDTAFLLGLAHWDPEHNTGTNTNFWVWNEGAWSRTGLPEDTPDGTEVGHLSVINTPVIVGDELILAGPWASPGQITGNTLPLSLNFRMGTASLLYEYVPLANVALASELNAARNELQSQVAAVQESVTTMRFTPIIEIAENQSLNLTLQQSGGRCTINAPETRVSFPAEPALGTNYLLNLVGDVECGLQIGDERLMLSGPGPVRFTYTTEGWERDGGTTRVEEPMVVQINLTATTTFLMPTANGSGDGAFTSKDLTVDWGDGSARVSYQGSSSVSKSLPAGNYTIQVWGKVDLLGQVAYSSSLNVWRTNLVSIDSWGDLQVRRLDYLFHDSSTKFQGVPASLPPTVVSLRSTFSANLRSSKLNNIVHWDTRNVTDMYGMFSGCPITQDLSNWDTSNVTNMGYTFHHTQGNNMDVGSWNVSKVTNMESMFQQATGFNRDLSSWDVSNVTNMMRMFENAYVFNQDISGWNVGNVLNMSSMFRSANAFNQPIGVWDVSKVTNMSNMFSFNTVFAQDITGWDVSQVTDMSGMFRSNSAFNAPIGTWDTRNVTNMSYMFHGNTVFNQPLAGWNTESLTHAVQMFGQSVFNQPIGSWNVSKVTNMEGMFFASVFNQNIEAWDVSKVTNMASMFSTSAFNQPLAGWDTSEVTTMSKMFWSTAAFNQPIGSWNVSKVTNMSDMFQSNTVFNQPIGAWTLGSGLNTRQMFDGNIAFNQNIGGWNVTGITRNNMTSMFRNATAFNQDLSGWCVSHISTLPPSFDTGATAWVLPKPVWGTCPEV
jgi:surface protein